MDRKAESGRASMIPVQLEKVFTIVTLFLVFSGFSVAVSRGDIYRYVDEEGVECFTDTPSKKGAVRIMKDRKDPPPQKTARIKHASPPRSQSGNNCPIQPPEQRSGALADFVLPVRGIISSQVGFRHDPIDGLLRHHNGLDIAVPEGTPVKPAAAGIVSFSGCRNGYGNMVAISHDGGTITIYAHNSVNLVKEGERVEAGSRIALSGSTGRSTGPHLHFEAWKDGVNITMTFLSGMSGKGAVPALYRRADIIRRITQADGTLLFTNLP